MNIDRAVLAMAGIITLISVMTAGQPRFRTRP